MKFKSERSLPTWKLNINWENVWFPWKCLLFMYWKIQYFKNCNNFIDKNDDLGQDFLDPVCLL